MFMADKKPVFGHFRENLDGLNSGVPTRTTATLTPTTLRNVEQTFIEITTPVENHQNQARFVPPVIQPSNQTHTKSNYVTVHDGKSWHGGSAKISETRNFASLEVLPKPQPAQTTKRSVGGRRPIRDKSISPEEEERRKVRRERNKLAAARCRKRRLDHTNELLMETDGLQEKKLGLQNEIKQLTSKKEELEYLLGHHSCLREHRPTSPPDVKPFIPIKAEKSGSEDAKTFIATAKRPQGKRPTTLLVQPPFPVPISVADGVAITTPSNGINFNFDSLMEGGTGLTPVSGPLIPSCSIQQRNSGCTDLSSPDSDEDVKEVYDLAVHRKSIRLP